MEDFLVLGIVPNTSIQISFIDWLIAIQLLIVAVLVIRISIKKYPSVRAAYLNRKALRLLTIHHLL